MILSSIKNPYIAVGIIGARRLPPEVKAIVSAVCLELKVNEEKVVQAEDRKRKHVLARQMCYKLMRDFEPNKTLKEMGSIFNGQDHTTAIFSITTMTNVIETDAEMRKIYERIKNKIYVNSPLDTNA